MERQAAEAAQVLAFGLLMAAAVVPSVAAQPAPGLERRIGPSDMRPLEPAPPQPEQQPQLQLPATPPQPPAAAEPPAAIRFVVSRIVLVGNTIFSNEELSSVTSQYEGRAVTSQDLLELRDALTRFYVDRGYVNSGAMIPDQDVIGGVVTIRIVEGNLNQIGIQGLHMLRQSYLEDRIRLRPWPHFAENKPLNVDELRERLQILLNDPAVERLNARLGPGTRPGESRLDVDVQEAPQFGGESRFNNYQVPSVGEYQGEAGLLVRSVVGYGDPLGLKGSFADGLQEGDLSYAIPLTAWDLGAYVTGQITRAKVVEGDFKDLDIESNTLSVEFGLQAPVYRDSEHDLGVSLGLSRRRSQTYLDGHTFSFSPGANNGQADVTAIRFVQNWLWRSLNQVAAARSMLSFGIDALGSTINSSGPDSRFFAWLGQAQYIRRLTDRDDQVVLRGNVQVAANPLLAIEQYAVGGPDSVRGYQKNQVVRDSGWNVSLENRISLVKVPIPYLSDDAFGSGWLQFAPFVDAGGGWNEQSGAGGQEVIYSVGTGLRWNAAPGLLGTVYYGYALTHVDKFGNNGLQDHGVSLELIAQF